MSIRWLFDSFRGHGALQGVDGMQIFFRVTSRASFRIKNADRSPTARYMQWKWPGIISGCGCEVQIAPRFNNLTILTLMSEMKNGFRKGGFYRAAIRSTTIFSNNLGSSGKHAPRTDSRKRTLSCEYESAWISSSSLIFSDQVGACRETSIKLVSPSTWLFNLISSAQHGRYPNIISTRGFIEKRNTCCRESYVMSWRCWIWLFSKPFVSQKNLQRGPLVPLHTWTPYLKENGIRVCWNLILIFKSEYCEDDWRSLMIDAESVDATQCEYFV